MSSKTSKAPGPTPPENTGAGRRQVVAWAMYDWANSAFAATVMATFFPVFFKEYWGAGMSATESTYQLGLANSMASVIVAVLAPVLGAIADRGNARKGLLGLFAAIGIAGTGALFFLQKGDWQGAFALFVAASVGFFGSLIFYDALLVSVAAENRFDRVSALGYALGYLGGGLLLAVNVAMTLKPAAFGLAGVPEAVRWSFLTVALWWAVFSIPIFVFVRERRSGAASCDLSGAVLGGFRQLRTTFSKIRKLRVVMVFLFGYWLYIDGIDTIIRMAVDYGLSLGFSSKSLILALLITQFIGFPAAIVFGRVGERLGPRTGIFIGLAVYILVTVWAYFMEREIEFYVLAAVVGLVQGGVQSLSRSFFARIIPEGQSAEFFGFFNLLGKFAAVIGPFLMGWVGLVTGSARGSILAVSLLFIFGAAFLTRVDEGEGKRLARELRE